MCGHGHNRSCTQEDRGQKRQRKRNGKGQKMQNKEEAGARLVTLLAKQVLKNALEIRELQTCVIRVFILPKDSDMAASIKSAYEEFGARFSNASKEHQTLGDLGKLEYMILVHVGFGAHVCWEEG